jgi:hypothetical protein
MREQATGSSLEIVRSRAERLQLDGQVGSIGFRHRAHLSNRVLEATSMAVTLHGLMPNHGTMHDELSVGVSQIGYRIEERSSFEPTVKSGLRGYLPLGYASAVSVQATCGGSRSLMSVRHRLRPFPAREAAVDPASITTVAVCLPARNPRAPKQAGEEAQRRFKATITE